jgi:ribosomal protein S18 acetylase RimI-like enzyme
MQIEIATRADEELYRAFLRLVPQLTKNNPAPTIKDLHKLVEDPASTLLIARSDSGEVVGALTLAVYRVPTGVRSIIEDVIVEAACRKQGVGEALMRRAVEEARRQGAQSISLTSNPAREEANKLYLKLGFKLRTTNSYQYKYK